MATIRQIQRTTLTPAVTALVTGPLPSNLPPPPSGFGYQVVPTAGGGAVRTGALIPTGQTQLSGMDVFKNVLVAIGPAASVMTGQIFGEATTLEAAATTFASKSPLVQNILPQGGTTWVSGMTSSAAFRDFLVRLAQARLTQARTSLVTTARTYLQGQAATLFPPIVLRLLAIRR